jgi:tRNA A37 threonylcarbamoyladenosine dehydratase
MSFYDRQKDIAMKTDIKVGIIGCGGVGYWVAKFLAMSGVNEFFLCDDDILEIHNLNRLDLPPGACGTNKADAAKITILAIRPDAIVRTIPFKFNPDFFKDKMDLVVDCTDKITSQKMISAFSKTKGIKYLKVGYDGTHITISNKIAAWGEDEGGYRITPSWVVPAVVVASMAVGSILKYFGKEMSMDISNLYRSM